MRKRMEKRAIMATLVVAAVLVTVGAAWAVPQVSEVVMTQRLDSRLVDISYELSGETAIVTLGIETNGVPIPDSAVTRLAGDVCKEVRPGSRSIVWNAGADWPENLTQDAKAKVTAWSTNAPPQVMVIDLREGASADSYPISYYVSIAALPYGGVTNSVYKDSYLAMRKIPNGTFTMGETNGTIAVTLTQDFYAGVFQVTQGQWHKIMGTDPSQFEGAFNPVEQVSYYDIRENPSGISIAIDPNWPQSDTVGVDSFMGKLRSKTGLTTFDLPTEAQWEYACRAGTISYYNDGFTTCLDTNVMNELGWYHGNAGITTHVVGEKTSNNWGLYDMHGNVWEWCLDWYASSLPGGDDPVGVASGSCRVRRGGCWSNVAEFSRSAKRVHNPPEHRYHANGFRLVRTLP